jgi:hypothetical protein
MVRTEIYANRSVKDDIIEKIEERTPNIAYSLIENVQGRGKNGIHLGTVIWPEINVLYVLYGDREQASAVAEAVEQIKRAFPTEGIKIFQFEMGMHKTEK